jgi:hypothetical protein
MVGPCISECQNLVLFTAAATLLQPQGMPVLHLDLEQYSEPYHVVCVDSNRWKLWMCQCICSTRAVLALVETLGVDVGRVHLLFLSVSELVTNAGKQTSISQ